jgi:hypothetical protein
MGRMAHLVFLRDWANGFGRAAGGSLAICLICRRDSSPASDSVSGGLGVHQFAFLCLQIRLLGLGQDQFRDY